VVCLLPLGYPRKTPGAPRRKELTELFSENAFQE
jgi:hypothetical protein